MPKLGFLRIKKKTIAHTILTKSNYKVEIF